MKYRELTLGEAKLFMDLLRATPDQISGLYETLCNQPGGWVIQAMNKHAQAMHIELDKAVQILVFDLSDGAIGKCVKYLEYIHKWIGEHPRPDGPVTMAEFGKMFPHDVINFEK